MKYVIIVRDDFQKNVETKKLINFKQVSNQQWQENIRSKDSRIT